MEQIEDKLPLVWRDARARIGDRELDSVDESGAPRSLDEDLGSGRAVPGSVLKQVGERLGDERGVHLDRGQAGRD